MKFDFKALLENKEKFFLEIFENGRFDLTIMSVLNIIAEFQTRQKRIGGYE